MIEPYRMVEPRVFTHSELLTVDSDSDGSRLAALCARLPRVYPDEPPHYDWMRGMLYAFLPSVVLWGLLLFTLWKAV